MTVIILYQLYYKCINSLPAIRRDKAEEETDYSIDPPDVDPLIIDPHIEDLQNADDKQGVMI